MNLDEYVERAVTDTPNAPAINRPNRPDISYRDLDERARRRAAWLELEVLQLSSSSTRFPEREVTTWINERSAKKFRRGC